MANKVEESITEENTIEPLSLEVRGSNGIDFREGWQTGDMTNGGVGIDTVWFNEDRRKYGGCINREEAKQLRDWLNLCIDKWEKEKENV